MAEQKVTEISVELITVTSIINTNTKAVLDFKLQIEWNKTRMTTPLIKTIDQYNEILNKIGHYKAIWTAFTPKHVEDQLNVN